MSGGRRERGRAGRPEIDELSGARMAKASRARSAETRLPADTKTRRPEAAESDGGAKARSPVAGNLRPRKRGPSGPRRWR